MKNREFIKKLNIYIRDFLKRTRELSKDFSNKFINKDFEALEKIENEIKKHKLEFSNKITNLCIELNKVIRIKKNKK